MPAPSPRITLRDIAKRAKLSVIAVSMALRDHPEIAVATRQRVQALARAMGYRRDALLSALSAYRRGGKRVGSLLAFLTTGPTPDDWKTGYGQLLLEGARQEAHRLGYELTRYWLDPAISGARHSQVLEARGFAGLLIAPLAAPQTRIELDWDRFCVVALGRTLRTPCLHFAAPNQYGGLLLTCAKLQALGYRRIGLAITAESDSYIDGRWSAAMLKFHSVNPAAQRVRPLWQATNELPAFRKWLTREKPDVVITYGGAHYQWLAATGRRVPDDIGYVLLSNYPQNRQFAALDHNHSHVGAAGVGLLHTQCVTHSRGLPAVRVSVVVDTTWVPGPTVRAGRQAG